MLTQTAATTWTLRGPDGTLETYTATAGAKSANLTLITARNGYEQKLVYSDVANTLLSSVTDSYGRMLTFTPNADGTIAGVMTPDGTMITYGYHAVAITGALTGNQLVSVTYPTMPAQVLTYQYGDASLPFALTGIIDENNDPYLSWTYDATGRGLTSASGGTGVNANLFTLAYPMPGVTTVTNALGALGVTDTYSFEMFQGAPRLMNISRAATNTTAAASESFTYDPTYGYLATRTDWNGNVTQYTYNNSHGLPNTVIEGYGTALARTVTITYDAYWIRLPHTITSEGVTRSIAYDPKFGNPLTITLTDTTTTTTTPYPTKGEARTWTNTWSTTGSNIGLLLSTTQPKGLGTLNPQVA